MDANEAAVGENSVKVGVAASFDYHFPTLICLL
ncbi:hypothetical protein AERO8C_20007 [Aeromonas veronii]|uniref:Uncharacterized protein n=1 Tax=Aeromonas veronii TaxID=654 RepID=A0A653KZT9_AERVE|nr:hypothetical protein AERO8C_20007 [Aeromonas veronii]